MPNKYCLLLIVLLIIIVLISNDGSAVFIVKSQQGRSAPRSAIGPASSSILLPIIIPPPRRTLMTIKDREYIRGERWEVRWRKGAGVRWQSRVGTLSSINLYFVGILLTTRSEILTSYTWKLQTNGGWVLETMATGPELIREYRPWNPSPTFWPRIVIFSGVWYFRIM